MSTPLREVAAVLGIEVDDKKLEEADDKLGEFIEKLKKVAAAGIWAEIAKESVEFFKGQVETATKLQNVSEKLDISVAQLKAFGFAAAAAGIDSEAAAGMLGRFERATSGAGKGGAAAAAELQKLGIKTKGAAAKNTVDTMLDLADAFQKMPTRAEKTAAAVKLFGREGLAMIPVLEQGREKMADLFKESEELGSGLGPEFYKNAKAVSEEFEHMQYGINSLKERALAAILPYLATIGKWFVDAVKKVIEFTKQTNILKTGLLFLGGVVLVKLATSLYAAAVKMGLLKGEMLATLIPLAVLYLLFDELFTMFTGGKSLLGDFLDDLGGVGTASGVVLELNAMWKDMTGLIGDAASALKDLFMSAIDGALGGIKGLGAAISDIVHLNFSDIGKDFSAAAASDFAAAGKRALAAGKTIVGNGTGAGSAGSNVNRLNALLAAVIDPRMLQSGMLGHATQGSIDATREGIKYQGKHLDTIEGRQALEGWHVAIPHHKGAPVASHHVVNQTNHNTVNVTEAKNPEQTGRAAAGGIEKGVKRANLNAQQRANVP